MKISEAMIVLAKLNPGDDVQLTFLTVTAAVSTRSNARDLSDNPNNYCSAGSNARDLSDNPNN